MQKLFITYWPAFNFSTLAGLSATGIWEGVIVDSNGLSQDLSYLLYTTMVLSIAGWSVYIFAKSNEKAVAPKMELGMLLK